MIAGAFADVHNRPNMKAVAEKRLQLEALRAPRHSATGRWIVNASLKVFTENFTTRGELGASLYIWRDGIEIEWRKLRRVMDGHYSDQVMDSWQPMRFAHSWRWARLQAHTLVRG